MTTDSLSFIPKALASNPKQSSTNVANLNFEFSLASMSQRS